MDIESVSAEPCVTTAVVLQYMQATDLYKDVVIPLKIGQRDLQIINCEKKDFPEHLSHCHQL